MDIYDSVMTKEGILSERSFLQQQNSQQNVNNHNNHNDNTRSTSINEAIDRLGIGKFQDDDNHNKNHNHNRNDNINGAICIDEAIDRIGIGKFQHRVLFAAGTCFMADSVEIMLLSFLSLVLKEEWGLDDDDNGATVASIASAMFAGATIGTLVFGRLGDVVGRKPILSCSALMISVFGLGTAFCQGYVSLLLVRFMVGFG